MLAKKNRLNLSLAKNSQMFKDKIVKRFFTNDFLFYYRPNNSILKIAAIAPSKLFNMAHQRNYYRRLIYNLIKKLAKEINKTQKQNLLEEQFDIIIVYKNKDFKKVNLEKDLDLFFKTTLKKE